MVFQYKKILPWIIFFIAVVGIGSWLIYRFSVEKSLQLISPNGKEIWQANKTYQITWKARNIGKVGIMLVKGEDAKEGKWLAKDISARKKKQDWSIFVWQTPGQDYKIAIFEYPWQEGNKIDYSDDFFTILGPQFASCDNLSIEAEWPFLPSDFPDLRKVFITAASWPGNLEGLEGTDKKCQQEAEKEGLEGKWKAFLGDDTIFAIERLNLEGIFIEAKPAALLPEGKTCHRLLGKNFDEFFKKLSDPLLLNQEKFEETFLKDLQNIWLGRVNKESKRDCTTVYAKYLSPDPSRNYSFTTTCQNWTIDQEIVPGYPPKPGEEIEFPICYTPEGKRINAAGLAGLSSGLIEKEKEKILTPSLGRSCNFSQKLLCVQQ